MQQLHMGNAGRSVGVVLGVLLGGTLCAQYRLQVVVVDSVTHEPVPQAELSNGTGRSLGRADEQGTFVFGSREALGDSLTVARFGYLRTSFSLPGNGGQVRIALLPEHFILPEHEVHAATPEIIFQNDSLHAAVFEPGAEGLWVLAYAHPRMWRDQARAGQEILRDVVVVLLDTQLNEAARKPLPGECLGLHIGRRGEAYVIGTDRVWPISLVDGHIVLKTMLTNVFREAVKPWTDSLAEHWLGSDFDPTYPGFDHLAYQPVEDIVSVFCSVQDTFVMELFRSQYKYMSGHDKVVAMDAELRTGIDRQVWAGYMTGFQNDPYFHAPYAPSFIRHDTILVFDHTSGQLRRFTQHRVPIDVIPITYHEGRIGRAWSGSIIQDRTTGEVYALFGSEGRTWLCGIDPATGQLGPKHMLDAKWPEQVRVNSGQAYYIHRPYESLQKRTLYRERMQ